ncbi:hypothetical protein Xen7305DRAFT_00014290 [Xenococcus sp. PCC 7305]|uniref:hypothetical protein n=1 Tax=Xenococcus sp. PCC 7305 TaxID=102125 RepID=UPI0002ACF9CD|nr:hypothetical protein [Xenococcus sp. PCC 7305]ELS01724.1 hypothetical protein Xen7305DRAFT_00014290 [Xenococcus sp. PCC 7305]
MEFIADGKTNAQSYLIAENDYTTIPLLTVGESIPLLEGELPFPGLNQESPLASDTETYDLPGGLDGVEHIAIDGVNYVFINHNLAANTATDLNGNPINGSRLSLLAFDEYWDVIGGRNLINDNTLTLNSLSSLTIAETGFRNSAGQALPYLFNGERNLEDTNDGIAYANSSDGTTTIPILGLGAFRKSQVYSPQDFRQATFVNGVSIGETVLLSLEAFDDGEIYLFKGDQGLTDVEDTLYVLRVKNGQGNILSDEFLLNDTTTFEYEWVLVDGNPLADPNAVPDGKAINTLNGDALANWVNGNDNGVPRSTNFNNLGALAEDPNNTGTFYFTTGSSAGSIYSLTFAEDSPTGEGTIELLLQNEGQETNGYDSITVDNNGNLILEDNDGGTFLYDIASDNLVTISGTNEAVLAPDAVLPWQSEGITEVDIDYQDSGLSAYLSNVDTRGSSITIDTGGNLASDGQLLLTIPPGTRAPSPFDIDIYRFQNVVIPGTHLYVGEAERETVKSDFGDTFVEEGFAFRASSEPKDQLIDLYRFRSNQGTYLYVGADERDNINNDVNYSGEYTEEGRAFSVYGVGEGKATPFNRFRRLDMIGVYMYATGDEAANIQTNLSDLYIDEGIAFEAEIL